MTKTPETAGPEWAPKLVQELRAEAQRAIGGAEKQIQDFVAQLVAKGHVTQEDAARAFGDTFKRLRKNREEMARFLEGGVEAMCRFLHVPTQAEVEKLQRRVAAIRARLEALAAAIDDKQ
jgi:polyhydroxyalkanoate synthesis regulator phasin